MIGNTLAFLLYDIKLSNSRKGFCQSKISVWANYGYTMRTFELVIDVHRF